MAMADEMQGIMSLPEEPAASTPEQTAAVDQMRSQLSPSEINTEMLGAAEEADPATVAEFKAELQDLQLPPEVLDALNTMVEEILDAPQDYEAIRAKYLAQGFEDLLPPEFDGSFFGALNMAVDQIRGATPAAQAPMPSGVNNIDDIFNYKPESAAAAPASMPPEAFAKGGIASLGRNGDTMLAHINPQEAALLRSRGGSGSINPRTGLPEFFSLKGAFKKLGGAVKKFAGSTVGKLVIGTALFMVAGPAAASMLGVSAPAAVSAISGFVSGAGGNLLAGGNLKDSLKIGAKGALTAGALKGVTGGKAAFQSVPKATDVSAVGSAGATSSPAVNTAEGITRKPLPLSPAEGGTGLGSAGPQAAAAAAPVAQGLGSLPATTATAPAGFFGNLKGAFTKDTLGAGGTDMGFGEGLKKAFLPSEIRAAAEAAGAAKPSILQQYGPLIGGGLGIMAATGGFDAQQPEVPAGFEDMAKGSSPGQKLLTEKPEQYGLQFGGARTTYGYNPAQYAMPYAPPTKMREGGVASLMGYKDGSPESYPRKTGHIAGPGTGTSDDVPAMLSDGEFVFTAKAVRAMGNGSRRAGAKRMYAMMKNLEDRKNG